MLLILTAWLCLFLLVELFKGVKTIILKKVAIKSEDAAQNNPIILTKHHFLL